VVLLADHDLGRADREQVDDGYIADLMAKDWGFWYTTVANLEKLEAAATRYDSLSPETRGAVAGRIARLRTRIDEKPKSGRWKLRSRVGTRARWYEEVQEVHR
jgi:hypothetical protein